MLLEVCSDFVCHQRPDFEGRELLKESSILLIGAFEKVFEQRFEIGQLIVRYNHVQFGVDKEAQMVLIILKHEQDN